jgi:two-component system, NarL family, invasion response regulator UvrY
MQVRQTAVESVIRVALCDDVEELRELVRDTLEELPGVEVIAAASDGSGCIDCVARHHPDVLLLDLSMPGPDGLEILAQITRRAAGTRVIVFSAFAAARMREPALARGAYEYVEKGAPLDEVVRAVRAAAVAV